MSAPLFGIRPPLFDPGIPAQTTPAFSTPALATPAITAGLNVASRQVHFDPGWFSLSLMPGPADLATGLPAVRVSLPPGPAGRRETVSISTMRGDGWLTAGDEPTVVRVAAGGGDVLVTQYWSGGDPSGGVPALKLMRLNPDGAPAAAPSPVVAPLAAPPLAAEIVAHVEGVGDVDGKFGDWVGMRASGRSIEGFGLTPRQGISTEDFDLRAVLGRDWLSPWIPGSRFCGSRGLALPLRGFCVRLHPAAAARCEVACYARFVDGSEVGPVGSDRLCAAPTLAALEAFQLHLRPLVP
jgi:hypothetical protein